MQYLGWVADIIGVFGGIFALFAWLQSRKTNRDMREEKERQDKIISIILNYADQSIDLPVGMTRSELSRAEILGRLCMIPMKKQGTRFELKYLNDPKFFKRLHEIKKGKNEATLEISCSMEEFGQFEIKQ